MALREQWVSVLMQTYGASAQNLAAAAAAKESLRDFCHPLAT